jgi:hypothetical protein
MFLPRDDGDGTNYTKILQFHEEYMIGGQEFREAKCGEALQHSRNADEIIRSRSDWTEPR